MATRILKENFPIHVCKDTSYYFELDSNLVVTELPMTTTYESASSTTILYKNISNQNITITVPQEGQYICFDKNPVTLVPTQHARIRYKGDGLLRHIEILLQDPSQLMRETIFEVDKNNITYPSYSCTYGQDIYIVNSAVDGLFVDFEITSYPDWITISKGTSQDITCPITITITINEGGTRTGEIVLTQNETGETITINIVQSPRLIEGIPVEYPYVTNENISTVNYSGVNDYVQEYSHANIGEQSWMRENFFQPNWGLIQSVQLNANRLWNWHNDSRYKDWSTKFNLDRFTGPEDPGLIDLVNEINAMFRSPLGSEHARALLYRFDGCQAEYLALQNRSEGETWVPEAETNAFDINTQYYTYPNKKTIVKYNNIYYIVNRLTDTQTEIPKENPITSSYFDVLEHADYLPHIIDYNDIDEMFGFVLGHNWDGESELTDEYVSSTTRGKTLINGQIPNNKCNFWYTYPESLPREVVLNGTDDYALSIFSTGAWHKTTETSAGTGNLGTLFITAHYLTKETVSTNDNVYLINAMQFRNMRTQYLNEECGPPNIGVYLTLEELDRICFGLTRVRECTSYEQKFVRSVKYNKLPFELFVKLDEEGNLVDLIKSTRGTTPPQDYIIMPHGFMRGAWMSKPNTYTVEQLNKVNEYLKLYAPGFINLWWPTPKRNLG